MDIATPGQDFSIPFAVDDMQYRLNVYRDGTVNFGLHWAHTPKGTTFRENDLFPEDPTYDDVDLARNAVKVFRKVRTLLERYIRVNRPHVLKFRATTLRKALVYGWMTRRLLRNVTRYDMCEYPKGTIVIFKLEQLVRH